MGLEDKKDGWHLAKKDLVKVSKTPDTKVSKVGGYHFYNKRMKA